MKLKGKKVLTKMETTPFSWAHTENHATNSNDL